MGCKNMLMDTIRWLKDLLFHLRVLSSHDAGWIPIRSLCCLVKLLCFQQQNLQKDHLWSQTNMSLWISRQMLLQSFHQPNTWIPNTINMRIQPSLPSIWNNIPSYGKVVIWWLTDYNLNTRLQSTSKMDFWFTEADLADDFVVTLHSHQLDLILR
jgi:hypothetical protein